MSDISRALLSWHQQVNYNAAQVNLKFPADFPSEMDMLKPHIDALALDYAIQGDQTGTGNAAGLLLHDVVRPHLSQTTMKMQDGRHIVEGISGNFWQAVEWLNSLSTDDYDISASGTNQAYNLVLRLPFTFPPFDAIPYFYPSRDFEEVTVQLDYGSIDAGTAGGFDTFDSGTIDALWEHHLRKKWITTPLRKWHERPASAGIVDLPKGLYHMIFIAKPKAADANLFDGGLLVSAKNWGYKGRDGRFLSRDFHAKLDKYRAAKVDDVAATIYDDRIQPIFMPFGRTNPNEGCIGPVHIEAVSSNDPQDYTVYALQNLDAVF